MFRTIKKIVLFNIYVLRNEDVTNGFAVEYRCPLSPSAVPLKYIAHPLPEDGRRPAQKYGALVNLCPLPLFQANRESSWDASMKKSDEFFSLRTRSVRLFVVVIVNGFACVVGQTEIDFYYLNCLIMFSCGFDEAVGML